MRGAEDGAEVGINIFLQDRVADVVASVRQAMEAGALPDISLVGMPPAKRADKLKTILRQYRQSK